MTHPAMSDTGRSDVVVSISVRTLLLAAGIVALGVPIAAGLQILVEEFTAARRARVAAADLAEQRQPA